MRNCSRFRTALAAASAAAKARLDKHTHTHGPMTTMMTGAAAANEKCARQDNRELFITVMRCNALARARVKCIRCALFRKTRALCVGFRACIECVTADYAVSVRGTVQVAFICMIVILLNNHRVHTCTCKCRWVPVSCRAVRIESVHSNWHFGVERRTHVVSCGRV